MDVHPRPQRPDPSSGRARRLVVGVGADGRAASAVIWAAAEASRTGRTLLLVSARPEEPSAGHHSHDLAGLARQLTLADVEQVVREGSPARVILDSDESAELTVVGRRGMSLLRRNMVGGTSLTVATEASCPVVVVPEEWIQPELCSAPILLGLGPVDLIEGAGVGERDPQREVIEFAFERAASLRVPLVVVCAWSLPPVFLHNASALRKCHAQFAERLDRRLAAWRILHPDVEVHAQSEPAPAVAALLAAGREAQLTVVGRRSGATPPSCGLGSTTRGLIRRAHGPVVVVPVGTGPEERDDSARRAP
jgi:nucleotide-binding universal stress UspA family protein